MHRVRWRHFPGQDLGGKTVFALLPAPQLTVLGQCWRLPYGPRCQRKSEAAVVRSQTTERRYIDNPSFPSTARAKTSIGEKARISAAGGFVDFGRVNGNLALSRAIGDFEFKKSADLSPEQQIVTAFPDVITHEISSDDEFLIIACDGETRIVLYGPNSD